MLPFRNGRSGNWGLTVCLLSVLILSIALALEPAMAAKRKGKKEKLLSPTPSASAGDLSMAGIRQGRRASGLWAIASLFIPTGRGFCRPDIEGREAGRFADPAADEVRADHQPQDRESAWDHDPAIVAAARRRRH